MDSCSAEEGRTLGCGMRRAWGVSDAGRERFYII